MRPDLSTSRAMVEVMEGLDFVGPAFTHEDLAGSVGRDSLGVLFQHSYTPGRYGGLLSTYGVEMWWKPNILAWGMPTGTTHGSPYFYDRWVPLVVMGAGIEGGIETPGAAHGPGAYAGSLGWDPVSGRPGRETLGVPEGLGVPGFPLFQEEARGAIDVGGVHQDLDRRLALFQGSDRWRSRGSCLNQVEEYPSRNERDDCQNVLLHNIAPSSFSRPRFWPPVTATSY